MTLLFSYGYASAKSAPHNTAIPIPAKKYRSLLICSGGEALTLVRVFLPLLALLSRDTTRTICWPNTGYNCTFFSVAEVAPSNNDTAARAGLGG